MVVRKKSARRRRRRPRDVRQHVSRGGGGGTHVRSAGFRGTRRPVRYPWSSSGAGRRGPVVRACASFIIIYFHVPGFPLRDNVGFFLVRRRPANSVYKKVRRNVRTPFRIILYRPVTRRAVVDAVCRTTLTCLFRSVRPYFEIFPAAVTPSRRRVSLHVYVYVSVFSVKTAFEFSTGFSKFKTVPSIVRFRTRASGRIIENHWCTLG